MPYNIFQSLSKVCTSLYGWLLSSFYVMLSFFATEQYCFYLVLTAILLDALFGIIASVTTRKKFALSKLGRHTTFKILSYGAALVIVFMVEKLAHDSGFIGVKVAAGWATACEFWSMSASILIVWPDAPFFRIMRSSLKGEISAKLGKPLDEIFTDN